MRIALTFLLPILFSLKLIGQPSNEVTQTTSRGPLSPSTLEKLHKMTPLFDGKSLQGWICSSNAWMAKAGSMASTGQGRGVIYTKADYANFRLIFSIRHLSGEPDHQACVLISCTRPTEGQKPLDALAGIQVQPPGGGDWDYRPGHNNNGANLFTKQPHPKFTPKEWSQVERLVNADLGTARMAVAQPPGTRAVEVLTFKDLSAARAGPIAWQMHNKGLLDEYKDVVIEIDPGNDRLITTE